MKKTQHYVPQFILDGFTNTEGQVIEIFISEKKIYPTNPANAMAENYTYEHPNFEPNSIEDLLSRIEGVVAPQIQSLRNEIESCNGEIPDFRAFQNKIEALYKFFILSYYRSGALLTEYSSFKKDDRIPLLTQKISNSRYLDALVETLKRGYHFAILKSNEDFLLSDQCISTVALQVKSHFWDVSNRHIGLQETLILVPISSSYYIALWNSKNGFGVRPNSVHPVSDELLYIINRSILNNSYVKCVGQKTERIEEVRDEFHFQSPTQVFAGGNPDGYSMGATLKKEVFLTDTEKKADDLLHFISFEKYKDVGVNQPCPCGSGKKYKKCHRDSYERTCIVMRTFTGPYPFGEWKPFVIPGIPVIEYPIDRWAGFSDESKNNQAKLN